MQKLNPKIIKYLERKIGQKEATIRTNISLLKRKFSGSTSNAVAHIYAQKNGYSVMRMMDQEDKKSLPNIEVNKPIKITQEKPVKKEKIIRFISYDSSDHFIKSHILEVNRAYTKGCLTSVNILIRKIIENLIIDILRKKFPPNGTNIGLYYDTNQTRYKDFSVILDNLYQKRTEFDGTDAKKIIERLVPLAKKIKDDANDKTHSWFYIVSSKKELDDLCINDIIELIKKLEVSVGIRKEGE